jgi:hypothetical protein
MGVMEDCYPAERLYLQRYSMDSNPITLQCGFKSHGALIVS